MSDEGKKDYDEDNDNVENDLSRWKEDSYMVPLLMISIADHRVLPVAVAWWVYKYKLQKWFTE